ncbi:MAG TPA: hypothetical protein VKY57_09065 [Chitinispirillaceae bacterium]|nr:hypothetical protein [Chitinispirillaceae bacterium]
MNSKYRQIVTIILISLINFLFSFKYISRTGKFSITVFGILIFTIIPVMILLVYNNNQKIPEKIKSLLNSRYLVWYLISILTIFSVAFFIIYPQNRLNLDRYEMINLFWDNLFSKKCPYCPRSEVTNIPGPFPFYFVVAFPFYLINEIGFLSLAGVIAFILITRFSKTRSVLDSNFIILILLSSPAVIYEILGRSTIFLNSVLILYLLLFVQKIRLENMKIIIVTGLFTGLILSTRSFASLFILLIFVYKYKMGFINRKTVITGLFAMVALAMTFIPVVALCKDDFISYNPVTVQFTLVPVSYAAAVCIAALAGVLFVNRFSTFCWFTGLVCILLFVGHMYYWNKRGLIDAIVNNSIDVAYVSMAIPFLLYSLFQKEIWTKNTALPC